MTPYFELGNPFPVGHINSGSMAYYFSSGSSYSAASYDYDHVHTTVECQQSWVWVCHYCGSTLDGKTMKCTQCGGEKREDNVAHRKHYATITYVEDRLVDTREASRKKKGFLSRFRRRG